MYCNGPGPNAYLLAYLLSTKCEWSVAGGGCGMVALVGLEDLIREKVEQDRWSHAQLSEFLKQSYQGFQGFSIHSIQKFCQEKNIHKTSRVTDQELDEAVSDAVSRVCSLLQYVKLIKLIIHFSVGPTYGRKNNDRLTCIRGDASKPVTSERITSTHQPLLSTIMKNSYS